MTSAKPTAKRWRRLAMAVIAATLGAAGQSWAQSNPRGVTWPASLYNPAPARGDVILPLPCGGAMTFRPIFAGVGGDAAKDRISDRRVRVGGADPETGYVDYFRIEHIAAPFFSKEAGDRYFLMGKYEVTTAQYQAVMGSACAAPGPTAARPATGLSWYDAVTFTRRLSAHLIKTAPPGLPRSGRAAGFARLPTDVEWEFAARGGVQVSEVEFGSRTFPMDGAIAGYAWNADPDSSGGSARPIGALKPNPVGLHDILGNVEEFVLDPFAMNRSGRLHGQVGGVTARGGSFRDYSDRLRSSMRAEHAPFTPEGEETRSDSIGLRVAVGANAVPDVSAAKALETEWRTQFSVRSGGRDPLSLLREATRTARDDRTRASLLEIEQAISAELGARNELEARALRSLLLSGAVLTQAMQSASPVLTARAEAIGDPNLPQANRAEIQKNQTDALERFRALGLTVNDTIARAATDFRPIQFREQIDLLRVELRTQNRAALIPAMEQFEQVVRLYRARPATSPRELWERLLNQKPAWLDQVRPQ